MCSDIPEILQGVGWIAGVWESTNGSGKFPTISEFSYNDHIEFVLCGKQPVLAYTGSSSHPERGNPMHLERGFLRARADKSLSFMVAHNFGLTTIEEGSVNNGVITLKSTNIGRMADAKDPQVTQIERSFRLVDNNTLEQELSMATSTTPVLSKHLKATYKRKS
ncbi:Peroxynitrite isomerase THAP4 [Pseudolycoriella hygida]|uniref:Peroxynitrite isomerase THAP4 n=1 Tax=Pseudolycoriella hygida TaxID=35572 RepID=A0A9Q0MP71_9DIPT|nr:Peroxynitrite isomerase THAP4 [Pseudolycoriella hygida]